eukprot:TRINITY_DN101538_c0_g1_i1.p1 TRINITY_DN101538_c0_g1~~TRINITY_DN101538_c0_g1_i1.p1  ORF type:complete len:281 (-),score=82.17 TRINITY_DN101538_c0_g1_i1:107-949(-)
MMPRWLVLLLFAFCVGSVDAGRSRRALVVAAAREDPKEKKKKKAMSVKDKVWELGKDMCKGRGDDPLCDRFRDSTTTTSTEAEETTTTTTTEERTTSTAEEVTTVATTTPEPESTTSEAETSTTKAEETAAASTETVTVATEEEEEEKVASASTSEEEGSTTTSTTTSLQQEAEETGLPAQGYSGRLVYHADGETFTGDWGKEGVPKRKRRTHPSEEDQGRKGAGRTTRASEQEAASSGPLPWGYKAPPRIPLPSGAPRLQLGLQSALVLGYMLAALLPW